MTHNDYQEQISQLIDAELDNTEQQTLFAHLSECAECREFFNSMLALRSSLNAHSTIAAPAELDRRMERATGETLRPTPAAFRLAVAASIAFILLVSSVLFGPQLLRTSTTDTPDGFVSTAPGMQPFSQPQ
jgi:anti-sigma factor RsiW